MSPTVSREQRATHAVKLAGEGLITVAVLGTGSIGMRHLATLAAMEGVRPLAIPLRPERRTELARRGYRTAASVTEARQMGVGLCIVATDTGRHLEDGLAALEQGCAVLVEKPMARTADAAVRLCRQAETAGRPLFVGCVLRFSESLNVFREWLPRIGRLHAVRIECQSYLPEWRPARPYREAYSARAEEGGVLRDLVHEIDYAGWMFGWPRAVQAWVRNLGRLGIEADEAAELAWQTPEGCVVSLSLDYLSRPSRRRIRASGEFGTLEWNGIEWAVALELAGAAPEIFQRPQTNEQLFTAQARAVVNACRGTGDPRLATGVDGVKALAVCDAARQASESRREEIVGQR